MKGTLGSRQTTVPNVHTYLANVSVIGDVRGHNEGDDDEKKRGYDEPQPPPVALLLTLLLQVAPARRRPNGGHSRRYRGLANVAPQRGEAHCGPALRAEAITRPQASAAANIRNLCLRHGLVVLHVDMDGIAAGLERRSSASNGHMGRQYGAFVVRTEVNLV